MKLMKMKMMKLSKREQGIVEAAIRVAVNTAIANITRERALKEVESQPPEMIGERMICSNCFRQMMRVVIGRLVVYDNNVVRSGDEFKCPSCNCSVISGLGSPFDLADAFNEITKRGGNPVDLRTKKD